MGTSNVKTVPNLLSGVGCVLCAVGANWCGGHRLPYGQQRQRYSCISRQNSVYAPQLNSVTVLEATTKACEPKSSQR